MDFSDVRFRTPQEYLDVHIVLKDWFKCQHWEDVRTAIAAKQALPALALIIIHDASVSEQRVGRDFVLDHQMIEEIKCDDYLNHHFDDNLASAMSYLKQKQDSVEEGLAYISTELKKTADTINYA